MFGERPLDIWGTYALYSEFVVGTNNANVPGIFEVNIQKTAQTMKKYDQTPRSVQPLRYLSISGLFLPAIKLSMLYFFLIRSGVGFSTSSSSP